MMIVLRDIPTNLRIRGIATMLAIARGGMIHRARAVNRSICETWVARAELEYSQIGLACLNCGRVTMWRAAGIVEVDS